jgi:hypothetical protein
MRTIPNLIANPRIPFQALFDHSDFIEALDPADQVKRSDKFPNPPDEVQAPLRKCGERLHEQQT